MNNGLVRTAGPRDLRSLPKAHLHLHLEGAMRPATLHELADRNGLPPPSLVGDGSFERFDQLYRAACSVLRGPDDLARIVREVVEDAAAAGAVWVELSELLTARQAERLGLPHEQAVLEVLLDAAARAERDTGVGVGLLLTARRDLPAEDALSLAHLAAWGAGRGVVGFGLAGTEAGYPPDPFARAFAVARGAGLVSAPHAVEHAGAPSVRGALDALGAQRIQHGVRAVEDPWLVERLAHDGICLDVCPTSNVHLKVISSLEQHPLPALLAAGVPVSLNADDPLFFGSGLLEEYELTRTMLGLDDRALADVASCSIRASGAPDHIKAAALAGVEHWAD
jgi:adenosine deaminase